MTTLIKDKTFAGLYKQAICKVFNEPDFVCSPRGQKVKECLDVCLELEDIKSNLFKCDDKKLTMPSGYTKREIALYLSATNDAKMFAKASPFWDTIKNADGTTNSAYGNLIFNSSLKDGRSQFDWAFDCLAADKDSRQAFMRYNNTSHQFTDNKDVPCTFIQVFHIRDNKLHSTTMMRSNDIVCGLVHDLPSFTLFQWLMFLKLKELAYPELEIGTYTHMVNSMHCYERDFELIEKRTHTELLPNSFPLPQNWRCIKSSDVAMLVDIKLNKQLQLFNDFEHPENKAFYDWILS